MLSCDTLAVSAKRSAYGCNLFGKNSDRPTAEAQSLRVYPAQSYGPGATLRMTDLTIPQAEKTYALVGSQPYWTWGFEMGFNEMGLIIGNEAQGSKNAAEEQTGILGLDLLRLALERAKDAREGIQVITGLLEQYGQNANASMLIDRRYENSFLLVDPQEIWLLETAGRQWVAKKIEDAIGISNCYTIRDDYDLCSRELEVTARKNRWLSPEEDFDFAKAYTLPAIRQTLAVPRMRRLNQLLAAQKLHDQAAIARILRDHFEGEITASRFADTAGTFFSICMHMRQWGESETAAGIVCSYDEQLGIVSRYAPAQPCLSVFLPVYQTGYLPQKLQYAGECFEEASLWWKLRRLALLVAVDEAEFAQEVRTALMILEDTIDHRREKTEAEAKQLLCTGDREAAFGLLNSLMDQAVEETEKLTDTLSEKMRRIIAARGGIYGIQKDNIIQYTQYSKMELI